jgi:hypothetical protein
MKKDCGNLRADLIAALADLNRDDFTHLSAIRDRDEKK